MTLDFIMTGVLFALGPTVFVLAWLFGGRTMFDSVTTALALIGFIAVLAVVAAIASRPS
jgi:hypothetical protein